MAFNITARALSGPLREQLVSCVYKPHSRAGRSSQDESEHWALPGTGHSLGDGCGVSDMCVLDVSNAANYIRSPGMSGNSGKALC